MVGSGRCNEACYVEECEWDDGDCDCSAGCSEWLIGDGTCNDECNVEECNFDNEDCEDTVTEEVV